MIRKEMKYYIISVIGTTFSIIFFITLSAFMTISEDLNKRVMEQERLIKELSMEIKQTELVCSGD